MKLSEYLCMTGCTFELSADGEFDVLEQCTRIKGERALTFLENENYVSALDNPNITCVICKPALRHVLPAHIAGIALTDAPKVLFFKLHNYLAANREKVPTRIDPTAKISPLASIAPDNVVIEANVEIEPFVVVNENTVVRAGTRICSGTTIGAQGFTVVKESDDEAFIVRDAGRTIIESHVQIGSNCTIERGTLQNDVTHIGPYCMIDNGVLVGHGTGIGRRGLIAAETIISGNCTFGKRIWIGVNGTISNAITVGDDARISLGAVVTKDVPAGATVTGNFAIDHKRFLQNLKQSVAEGATNTSRGGMII